MLSFIKANIKIAILIGLAFCLCSGFAVAKPQVLYKGEINAFKLNIRTAPSRKADVLEVVEKGLIVDVVSPKGPEGSWLTVYYQGKKGYIKNRPQYIILHPVAVKKKELTRKSKSKKVQVKQVKKKEAVAPPKPDVSSQAKKNKDPETGQESIRSESQQIDEKIEKEKKLVQTFSQKEREIIDGLNEIDYALNKARITVKTLSAEIKILEKKIGGLNLDKARLRKDIEVNREYAGKRLKALYKMNMIGRLDAAGMPSTIFDFFLQQNAMKRVINKDLNILEGQKSAYESLAELEKKLQKEVKAKSDLENRLIDQIRINKKETLKKELILKEIRQKKRLSLASVEALKEAQIRLDNQIEDLKPALNAHKVQLPFQSYKGRLNFPVNGQIITRFGPSKTQDGKAFTFQKGIDIKVERGEPVKSVFKGKVMYAQWLKGYGNLLIIDHGDNYYTLYAHVEEIFKQTGEMVEKEEVIATAGDTGSIKGICLHFEVRHHGKPVDPLKWLKKGA